MNIRWLPTSYRSGARDASQEKSASSGKLILEWKRAEREEFRRQVLANLSAGSLAHLTAIGCDHEGLGVVHVELEIRASARVQISGAKL
jgi:hypothetical protein